MYRCTGGEVTIGIGHAIPNADLACQLNWQIDGAPAGADQVRADYAAVANAPIGQLASTYAGLTQCRMAAADIAALVEDDIPAYEAKLRARLPNWDSYPEPAQEALFDMGYNLGPDGLMKFVNMLAAVNAGDWTTAAAQCHRRGIGNDRNQETAQLFLKAGTASAAAS